MSSREAVSQEFFIGKQFWLSACDYSTVQVESWWREGQFRSADGMSFTLNGVTYTAYEDDNDDYRSTCEGIIVSDVPLTNTFKPVEVVGRDCKSTSSYRTDDVVELIDINTGKTVLKFGTENTDDYYPSCILYFDPTAMVTNA